MSRSSHDELGAELDRLARRAAQGDHGALSELVREIQHPMYRLALRFLGDPEDAEDACQEILIRILTRLGTFEGRAKFSTWAYTVAVRSLIRTRKRLYESAVRGAEEYAAALDAGMGDVDPTLEEAEYRLLPEEVRISCTNGMLLCLPRPQRAAYVLADVLGLTDGEGAEILDCSREAFRQRVSRARRTLRFVIDNRCGLVDPANPCRCGRQIASGEAAGILDRRRLPLARHSREEARAWVEPVAKQLDRRPLPVRPLRRAGAAVGRPEGAIPRAAERGVRRHCPAKRRSEVGGYVRSNAPSRGRRTAGPSGAAANIDPRGGA